MKKIKYITVLSMCAFMTFSSCKKDNENGPEVNNQDQTTQKLIDFKNKLNSKDGNSITVENATWHLEGLLNYENANNNHDMNSIIHQYDTLTYDFSGENINYNELGVVYLDLNKKLNQYIQLNPNSKFDLIDLNLVKSDNEITVVMISSFGTSSAKLNYQPFGSSDYWRWGWNLGKCDGAFIGYDAADQLKYKFNNPIGNFVPGYYTSVEMKSIFFSSYPDPSYPGAFGEYMMFFTSGYGSGPGTNNEPCISPSDLNYYLGKFDYIKDLNCPSGKRFKNANVIETIPGSIGTWGRAHDYQLYYGVFNSGPNPN